MKSSAIAILVLFGVLPLSASAQAGFGRGRILKALDLNGDGRLTRDEIQRAAQSLMFLDDDGDGVLSKQEAAGRSRWGDMDDMGDWGGGFSRRRRSRPKEGGVTPSQLKPEDGAASIADRAAFQALHQKGENILGEAGLEYVKFQIEKPGTKSPELFFINTKKHVAHSIFMNAIGRSMGRDGMRGALNYRPFLIAPDGSQGLYTFAFEMQNAFPFAKIRFAFELLQEKAPLLRGKLAYTPMARHRDRYMEEREQYEKAGLPVVLPESVFRDAGFLPLNVAKSFGRLRLIKEGERPRPRDIVIMKVLPNEMPRVAGVITEVRQTPLSHVNLRAVQDDVPNAFLTNASKNRSIARLIGRFVFYEVTREGFTVREASAEEVDAHFKAIRSAPALVPQRNLSVTEIRPLSEVAFANASAFGVKAANLATLTRIGVPESAVPQGFAVPFHFYDSFMQHNGLYAAARLMIGAEGFSDDPDHRVKALKAFRKKIKRARFAPPAAAAIKELQNSFLDGQSIRCRSSTNNEDLPGFSGAGLYDSFTHKPDEGDLTKSIKQVYASLWNFRAYEEREFFRVDHFRTAMGVLLHKNFKGELANGVAVTEDILYAASRRAQDKRYFVNAQLGEDLVTNPEGDSVPEEILLSPWFPVDDRVVRFSNRLKAGGRVLNVEQISALRLYLKTIERGFRELYGKKAGDQFAMEVEFKVTPDGVVWIKQARPWIF